MTDLKILTIMDLLPVVAVEFAQGISPLSLLITGSSLDQATTVQINDIAAPEFMILSPTRILAQVPPSQASYIVRKVAVIAEVPSLNRRSILHFEVPGSIKGLAGLEKLVQLFCKLLLQSPGSDRFNTSLGGGLLKTIGRNVSKNDASNLQASVVGAVSRTKEQILSLQGSNSRIPADERLMNVTTDAVSFDAANTTLTARISISAVSGKLAVANLSV